MMEAKFFTLAIIIIVNKLKQFAFVWELQQFKYADFDDC